MIAAVLLLSSAGRLGAQDADLTYAQYGADAAASLVHVWYSAGKWRMCSYTGCPERNQDWGADSLTYALYLRWKLSGDASLTPYFAALLSTAPYYAAPCRTAACRQWSDVPEWDALAALRAYDATGHNRRALELAKAAFAAVDQSSVYALGACPQISYQQPFGGSNKLKTLETDSNAIRAAVLLYHATGDIHYLTKALARYHAVRRYFLDSGVPLYSVYVFDDGRTCRQLPHRFFASVNGNMILAGIELHAVTGDAAYLDDAIATATAVDRHLSDGRGIYANLQAENDIAEPLVEAMYALAAREHQPFARAWLHRNAAAAAATRTANGSFGRFFDGPVPAGAVTAWQTNGAYALMIAAAQLEPQNRPADRAWSAAAYVPLDVRTLPATIRFTGTSIALLGTIGDRCCEDGHALIYVDGQETFDDSGIWQNKSCSGSPLERAVLFAWQFSQNGRHSIRIDVPTDNAKEGGAYLHLSGYLVK